MKVEGLPFERESYRAAHLSDSMTHAEFMADLDYVEVCARCGHTHKYHDETEADRALWNQFYFAHLPVPASTLCNKCMCHFLQFKTAIDDCKDLSTCVNYIERAISCRKHFLKTAEKSKRQDNLDKCLSMRLKEF